MALPLVLVVCWLLVSAPAASARVIPEGAALWFACTEPEFTGPKSLDCPLPYNPLYLSTFLANFTRFTPENEFQMAYLEPVEDHFDFTVADQIAGFALAHQLTIRGHSLLWWGEEPWWLDHPLLPWTHTELQRVMDDYITTVVSHFATDFPGVVTEWDVVNEPISPRGNLIPTVWERVLGPSYIPTALMEAHAADPAADLVINDEGSGAPGPETTAMLALATQLVQEGAPLDTVGFEAHVSPATAATLPQLLSLWRQYGALGLKVEVTELDVADDDGVDDPAAKQAVFERYAEACQLSPNCTGYSVWGVADPYSWLGAGSDSLLYSNSFQPSPAVSVVKDDLTGVSRTARGAAGSRHRHKPAAHKPPAHKPAAHKPAAHKPAAHKPAAAPPRGRQRDRRIFLRTD